MTFGVYAGEGDPSAADALTGKESRTEIVDITIGLEKASILCYLCLKDMVPPDYGQDRLDDIIGQERRHIIQLNGILGKL